MFWRFLPSDDEVLEAKKKKKKGTQAILILEKLLNIKKIEGPCLTEVEIGKFINQSVVKLGS